MKTVLRYGLILGIICISAAGLLAAVNSITERKIIAQAKEQEDKALSEVLPGILHFEPIKSSDGSVLYYKAFDGNEKLAGVAFKAAARGYSGVIETMAGMALDGEINMIKVMNQNETPGLGSRILEPAFTGQFSGKNILQLNQVKAITGATISSKAVIDSVKKKSEEVKLLLGDISKK